LVGFPPTPCFLARFRLTADLICFFVIRLAFAAGTHFGYFFFPALGLPHFENPPPFLGLDISTQFCLNQVLNPPTAIIYPPYA
jgi:hypothetical protein